MFYQLHGWCQINWDSFSHWDDWESVPINLKSPYNSWSFNKKNRSCSQVHLTLRSTRLKWLNSVKWMIICRDRVTLLLVFLWSRFLSFFRWESWRNSSSRHAENVCQASDGSDQHVIHLCLMSYDSYSQTRLLRYTNSSLHGLLLFGWL